MVSPAAQATELLGHPLMALLGPADAVSVSAGPYYCSVSVQLAAGGHERRRAISRLLGRATTAERYWLGGRARGADRYAWYRWRDGAIMISVSSPAAT